MKFVLNLCVGVVGTDIATHSSTIAATFAGLATGIWMTTQTVIAIRNARKK